MKILYHYPPIVAFLPSNPKTVKAFPEREMNPNEAC